MFMNARGSLECPFCSNKMVHFVFEPDRDVRQFELKPHKLGIYVNGRFYELPVAAPWERDAICLHCKFIGWGGKRDFDVNVATFPNGSLLPEIQDLRRLKSSTVGVLSLYLSNAASELAFRHQTIDEIFEAKEVKSTVEMSSRFGMGQMECLQIIVSQNYQALFS
jgi:hypothetical protein